MVASAENNPFILRGSGSIRGTRRQYIYGPLKTHIHEIQSVCLLKDSIYKYTGQSFFTLRLELGGFYGRNMT